MNPKTSWNPSSATTVVSKEKRPPMTSAQVSRLRTLQKRIDSEVTVSLEEKKRRTNSA